MPQRPRGPAPPRAPACGERGGVRRRGGPACRGAEGRRRSGIGGRCHRAPADAGRGGREGWQERAHGSLPGPAAHLAGLAALGAGALSPQAVLQACILLENTWRSKMAAPGGLLQESIDRTLQWTGGEQRRSELQGPAGIALLMHTAAAAAAVACAPSYSAQVIFLHHAFPTLHHAPGGRQTDAGVLQVRVLESLLAALQPAFVPCSQCALVQGDRSATRHSAADIIPPSALPLAAPALPPRPPAGTPLLPCPLQRCRAGAAGCQGDGPTVPAAEAAGRHGAAAPGGDGTAHALPRPRRWPAYSACSGVEQSTLQHRTCRTALLCCHTMPVAHSGRRQQLLACLAFHVSPPAPGHKRFPKSRR